jgi:hypothetical protein
LDLGTALWLGSAVGEACVLSLILYKRTWKLLPVFSIYVAWTLVSDIALYYLYRTMPSHKIQLYTVETSIDSFLQFAVLVELAWSVLRPVRASLPRGAIVVLAVLIALAGLIIWPLAGKAVSANTLPSARFLVQLIQTVAILRVGFFLVVASFSQLLSIGWKDRELQVATGLGFYSIIALIVAILETHPLPKGQAEMLDNALVVGYIFSLSYWVLSFATNEQKRKEFTPQMQQLLLLMGGGARAGRIALTDLPNERLRKKDR